MENDIFSKTECFYIVKFELVVILIIVDSEGFYYLLYTSIYFIRTASKFR